MNADRLLALRYAGLNFFIAGPLVVISVYLPKMLQEKQFSLLEIGLA